MNTKITTALAVLLLSGASTAALAQEHDHRDAAAQPGAQPHAAPPAPQGGHDRSGGAPPPGAQPHFERGGPPQVGQQHFERGGPPQGGQALNRDAGRQWDHERGPREVVPPAVNRSWNGQPGAAGQAWDGRRDGGRIVGGAPDHRDDRWVGGRTGRDGHWDGDRSGAQQRWQAGRFPPVYWSQQRYRIGGYRAPYGYYSRNWAFGEFLPRGWYGQNYWLEDFLDYGLPYPPPGYEWVRVGGDALLIDRFSGRIVQVVRAIFW